MKRGFLLLSKVVLFFIGTTNNYANTLNDLDSNFSYSIDVISTTWNGENWSNGYPDSQTEVIVTGELILTESLHVKKLTIESTGSVVVTSGVNLIITEELINNSAPSSFIVENDGNLIQVNDVANIGNITVKHNSTPMVRNDMSFWSSPVSGQNIRQFSPETLFNRFWRYNEGNDEFYQILTGENDPSEFQRGVGYSIRVRNTLQPNNSTIHNGQFIGVPYNGDIYVDILRNNRGFNLIGNPYSSDVDIDKFFEANPHVRSLYFWTHKFPLGHQNYDNNYEIVTRGGSENPSFDRLKVGEGFLVLIEQDNDSPVFFNNEMRNVEISTKDRFWVQLTRETEIQNQISIGFIENATDGFDLNYDRVALTYLATGVYSMVNGNKLIIDAKSPEFSIDRVIDLGFKTADAGNFSISIPTVQGLFGDNQTIYLKDYQTQTLHNLSTGAYSFTSESGEFNERFQIVFKESDFLSLTQLNKDNDLLIYKSNNDVVVKSLNVKLKSVEIFDIQGKRITSIDGDSRHELLINNLSKGVYILKVTDINGKVTTKKITK